MSVSSTKKALTTWRHRIWHSHSAFPRSLKVWLKKALQALYDTNLMSSWAAGPKRNGWIHAKGLGEYSTHTSNIYLKKYLLNPKYLILYPRIATACPNRNLKRPQNKKSLTGYWISVAFRHTAGVLHLQVMESSTSSLFAFPSPHFPSGRPVIFLPSVDKVRIHLNCFLPNVIHVRTMWMCYFKLFSELNVLFSFFSNLFIHYF
jgi:hypothetical protein